MSWALRSPKPWASDSPAARTASREAAESGFTDRACQLPQNWLSRWVRPVSPGSSMIVSMFAERVGLGLELAEVRRAAAEAEVGELVAQARVLRGDDAGAELARAHRRC